MGQPFCKSLIGFHNNSIEGLLLGVTALANAKVVTALTQNLIGLHDSVGAV